MGPYSGQGISASSSCAVSSPRTSSVPVVVVVVGGGGRTWMEITLDSLLADNGPFVMYVMICHCCTS